MGKYFGTDGFRGEANKELTADHAYRVGRFLGWYYGECKRRNGDHTRPRIVIGKHGAMLQTIGSEAREDIEKLLGLHVNLKLWVKVRPDWRNRASDLRTLGYDAK